MDLKIPVSSKVSNIEEIDSSWSLAISIIPFGFIILERFFSIFFQAEDGIREVAVTGVQTCALPIFARTERMYATWYNAASAGKASTDPGYGITASGVPVTRGIVAVDPKVIRLGTRPYIPRY